MTHAPHQIIHPSPRPRRRGPRAVALAAGVAVLCFALAPPSGGVGAGPHSKSEVVAAEASRALDSLARWETTQDPADYVRYVQRRERAATLTARDLQVDPAALRAAWADAPAPKQHALLVAMSQLGVPYRNLQSDPEVGFDCSGLTIYAFAEAGVDIPRVSSDQISDAESIERDEAEAGDLVYYPGHIGIYLGAQTYVHSPYTGSHVEAVLLPERSLRFGDAVDDGIDGDAAEAG